tara:strand:+ start:43 stop:174 length:132 start_codon:yes stop_codon:yes gene_type:complete
MPVVKRKSGGYKVKNTKTKKRMTKPQAQRQQKAIYASKKGKKK